MTTALRVLIIEDSARDAELLILALERGGYDPTVVRVETAAAMTAALDIQSWDIILSDYNMPHFSGLAALEVVKQRHIDLPFIVVSGTIGEELAVAAMKAGAHDYLMKGNLARLAPAIDRELREAEERRTRRQAEEALQYQALHDALTDLPNRAVLQDRLEQAILATRRTNAPVALLLLDLDHFKDVNDTFGHHYGDLLLQQLGPRLEGAVRRSDTVARLGGDEFALLLPGTDAPGATQAAAAVLGALEQPFLLEGHRFDIGASIGIAVFPEHGTEARTLLQRADVAMYLAKEAQSGCALYDAEDDQYSPDRLALIGALRQGIEQNQLVLYYQPKVTLQTGQVAGVEALVRWQHPKRGFIPPDQFIGLAEHTGLIKPLTRWVLGEAMQQCRRWHRAGLDLCVSVNLSARNLQDPQLGSVICDLLDTCRVEPSWFEVEVTESTVMADSAGPSHNLARLHEQGVRVSIDDFGTGFSSLARLKRLPVDAMKIDKSFVLDMARDSDDRAIVSAVVALGHSLGLEVVAEGVEDKETLELLRVLGCDTVQGYYLSRALPAEACTTWVGSSVTQTA